MLKSPWLIAHDECLSSRVPTCMLAMYTLVSLRHAYCCLNSRTVIVFDDEPSDGELVDGLTCPGSPGMGVCDQLAAPHSHKNRELDQLNGSRMASSTSTHRSGQLSGHNDAVDNTPEHPPSPITTRGIYRVLQPEKLEL